MNHLQPKKYLLPFSLICLFALLSCRKKDERYEGVYIGQERYTIYDTYGQSYSFDTTFHQEFKLTYYKKNYIVLRLFDNPYNSEFAFQHEDIVDHEYYPFSETYYDNQGNLIGTYGHIKFSGDSINFVDMDFFNGELETWEFSGKRN